jgi:2-oxoglutarate ferredoxin oxidoreductase subunit alpha
MIGLTVFDFIEYPSLIRGGHNAYWITFSEDEVFSVEKKINVLVALNEETIKSHLGEMEKDGVVIFDNDVIKLNSSFHKDSVNFIGVPFLKLVERVGGKPVMRNTAALGSSIALFDFEIEYLNQALKKEFEDKGPEIINANIKVGKAGYDFLKKNFKKKFPYKLDATSQKTKKLVLSGNDAICLGAIEAGCKFMASYPMTPASSILHTMASLQAKYNFVVKHAEDEISAINMAIGAFFAGCRSMVATSGGGFALMVEGVSLAGMTESGIVIVEAQRPAPATGMPTWTEQGDLKFVLSAGHGEFPRIVLAPGDQNECFYETFRAFNLAEKFQTPTLILSDKFLSESHKSVDYFKTANLKIVRGKYVRDAVPNKEGYLKRYEFTEDGVSKRLIPGSGGCFMADSYEHDEFGYTTEGAQDRTKMVDKRNRKASSIKKESPEPNLYGPKEAETTIVSWGSTKCPILAALDEFGPNQTKVNFLHYVYIEPFKEEAVLNARKKSKRLVILENNSTSQFGQVVKMHTGIDFDEKILKYDGRPFYPEEIVDKLRRI